jgi:adenosylhomocysteine nucleosidase
MNAIATATAPALTVIAAPMPEELAPLRARLTGARRLRLGLPGVWTGVLEGAPVALAVTGDGPRQAAAGADRLLRQLAAARLLVIGVAGALSPELRPGALVVSARVDREGEQAASFMPDPLLLAGAIEAAEARPAVLVTARRLADSADERRRLLAGALGRGRCPPSKMAIAAAVDTESAAMVEVAARARVPWVVVRAISDATDEALPALLERCRDDGGAIRRGRVARALLRRPHQLPALLALRARVARCSQDLAVAACRLLAASAAPGSLAETRWR